jgi:NitT/TauT family transport system permease protein
MLWQFLATYLDSKNLPSPRIVALAFWQGCINGQIPFHLGMTLLRLIASFSVAMLLGCAIGIVIGRNKKLDRFFDNWLVIFLNIPALVTIILCYVWFGLNEAAAILAVVVNKLPNVVVTIREGARALDQDLLEMARCYRFGRRKTLLHVVWPQLYPYVMGATRSGLALVWKIILVVELLGRSNGIGYQLHLFFQLFDVANILAYTFAFVTVIQLLEMIVLKPLDNKAQRWRRQLDRS